MLRMQSASVRGQFPPIVVPRLIAVELLSWKTGRLDWLRRIDHEFCKHSSFYAIHTVSKGKHWRGLSGGIVVPRMAMENDAR